MSAAEFVPLGGGLDDLRTAAAGCRGCELWQDATRTVFSAGRLLVKAVDQAGPGKRRIHQTPERVHVDACAPWLSAELSLLAPAVVVLLGQSFRVTRQRGELLGRPEGGRYLATVHRSAVLRSDDQDAAYAGLVADLRVAAQALRASDG